MILCRGIFDEEELKRLEGFIHNNNSYNEPMTLLLRRTFRIKRAGTIPAEGRSDASMPERKTARQF
jgi:hypothetical protein